MARSTNSDAAKYESLVMSMAKGVPVSDWCRLTKTARSTAAKCQSEPEFTSDVQEFHRKLLHLAVSKFTRAVNLVADGTIKLAGSALSEPTKLSAQRSMMQNLVKITEFADLEQRIKELEAKVKEKEEEEKEKDRR
jgi:hypothetical protein